MRVSFKWLLIGIGVLYYAEISQALPGRKIRLKQYEVKFGTWPLMEITKLQKRPRHKFRPLGGFMKHAIPSNFQVHQGLQTAAYQHGGGIGGVGSLGGISSSLASANPSNFQVHQGLQTAAYQHGSSIGGVGSLGGISSSLTSANPSIYGFPRGQPQTVVYIPAGAAAPHSAHGPPAMVFQPIQNAPSFHIPTNVARPAYTKFKDAPKKSSLRSLFGNIMGGAAYSGYFDQKSKSPKNFGKDNYSGSIQSHYSPGPTFGYNGGFSSNTFQDNNYRPGPPPGYNSALNSNHFEGNNYKSAPPSQITHNPPMIDISNGQVSQGYQPQPPPGPWGSFSQQFSVHAPSPPLTMGNIAHNSRFSMQKVPKVPPVITIGSHPPEGYSMVHGEQQLITLKLPNSQSSSTMTLEDLAAGAEYRVGEGSNWNKDWRRIGHENSPGQDSQSSQQVDKKLPEVGAIYTVNMVLQTPNISAPMNGSQSFSFQQGMHEMKKTYSENKQSPLDSQVKLLGKLFTDLQRLKPPKTSIDSEPNSASSRVGSHYTPSGTWFKGDGKPRVDAPIMAVHIQSYSVPEPASSDSDVLDSVRMFGLPGHRFEFGNTNEIVNLMDTAQKADASRILLNELGSNQREVNDNLQEWIKSYVSLTRKVNHEAHAKGENIANKSFRQHQYYMPPNGPNAGSYPVDPKMFSQGAAITNAGAIATYRG